MLAGCFGSKADLSQDFGPFADQCSFGIRSKGHVIKTFCIVASRQPLPWLLDVRQRSPKALLLLNPLALY